MQERKKEVKYELELELEANEQLLIKSQHFSTKDIEFNKYFYPLIFGIVGLALLVICASIIAINIIFIFKIFEILFFSILSMIGFLLFAMSCYLLISKFYEANTYFIITSARIMRLVGLKHEIRIKRQIRLLEISHFFDWDNAIEVFPEKSADIGYYNGTETEQEFSYKRLGLGGILIRFNDPKGESVKEEMKKILIKNANLQKHPNLEFLYYKIDGM